MKKHRRLIFLTYSVTFFSEWKMPSGKSIDPLLFEEAGTKRRARSVHGMESIPPLHRFRHRWRPHTTNMMKPRTPAATTYVELRRQSFLGEGGSLHTSGPPPNQ